jgi:UDP-glucuronate 4-epimerase
MKQTVLVTGAAGFIGYHTSEKLLGCGFDVVGVDSFSDLLYDPAVKRQNARDIEAFAISQDATFYLEEGDIRDAAFLDAVFGDRRIDAVVHLAALAGVRPSIDNPGLYIDVNVCGTQRLLDCMVEACVKRLVFASSSSVYGNSKKVPFSETDQVNRAISPYAATKIAGEVLCYTYHHLFGVSTACLRLFTAYGPRQRPDLAIHKFTNLILSDKPVTLFGDGSTTRDYTYVKDIAEGIAKALLWTEEKGVYDIFNLGSGNPVKLYDLVETLSRHLGMPCRKIHIPMQPGDVDHTCAKIAHARRMLGYEPKTGFEEGIEAFADWYRRN